MLVPDAWRMRKSLVGSGVICMPGMLWLSICACALAAIRTTPAMQERQVRNMDSSQTRLFADVRRADETAGSNEEDGEGLRRSLWRSRGGMPSGLIASGHEHRRDRD